jgi:hypothetical protein
MTIFGKRLSEYVRFARVFLALILVVGIARLALSLGGAPNDLARWISISVVMWIGIFYYAVRVYTTGFGTYRHLLPIYFLQSLAAQAVIVPGIIIAIMTGQDNIFSIPEYSFGGDGKTWGHVAAHLFIGTTIGSLVGCLFGSLVMFVTKKLTRDKAPSVARA